MIPKTTDSEALKDLWNWRPLTIGSIVLRLISRIISNQLMKACPLNARQRGFIAMFGCLENFKILHIILNQAKKCKKSLGVVFVDIAKVWSCNTVSNIMWVVRERGLDQHMVDIISDSYKNVHTYIEVGKESLSSIAIKVGVKQGDPISPLLFNLLLDPLITTLEKTRMGFSFGINKITSLAFADDLVLLSDTWEDMNINIGILETFCGLTGLKIQVNKCYGFFCKPHSRLTYY